MTNLTLTAAYLGLALMPMAAAAQTHIKKAFEDLIDDDNVKITPSQSLVKNPETGVKESQCDIYRFTLSKESGNRLKDIQKAFRQDSDAAYHIGSGVKGDNNGGVSLAVGNGNSGVSLGVEEGMSYTYACFIAPEDTAGNHRYAYGMEWIEGADGVRGTLAVTYATTQSYRQQQSKGFVFMTEAGGKALYHLEGMKVSKNGRVELGNAATSYGDSWFDVFTGYITAMTTADASTRRALASKIYSHTKKLKGVDVRDKDTARELLKSMLNDDDRYKDGILQELLNGALMNIK